MNLRLAIRNIFRNRWRSALTAGGIAVAVGMLVWANCMNDAFLELMVENSIGRQLGEVQIQTAEYIDEPSIFNGMPDDPAMLKAVRETAGVEAASARVLAFGLIGHEKRSVVGQMIGVDPAQEAAVSGIDEGVEAGAWLTPEPAPIPGPRQVVLGKALAKQLDTKIGDELVVFLQAADGSLGNEVLKVQGIAGTGNSELDRIALYGHLSDVQYLTALDGKVHEVAVSLARGADSRLVAEDLRARVTSGPVVRAWQEIMPEFEQLLEFARNQSFFFYFVIGLIAALGIFNTQRMSVLDRRREFGVLLAIGLSPGRLGRIVVFEAIALTTLGAIAGVLWGGGLSWYHATAGFDWGALGEGVDSMEFGGIAMDSVMYFVLTPRAFIEPVVVIVGISAICGFWPALRAARLDAVRAISGRT